MIRTSMIALIAVALLPLSLQAQRPAEATGRIEAALDRVAAAGIPRPILEARVREGRAKGVPEERIAAVVERRAAALVQAREVMAPVARNLSAADLSAGADAMEAGVGGGALRAVSEAARTQDRPVAIAVLTFLSSDEVGLPVAEALRQVESALEKGPDALRELPARAMAARGRRGPPEGVGRGPQGRGAAGGARGGPPAGLPTPGQGPGVGGAPGGKPGGTPGGPPGGLPGGRP